MITLLSVCITRTSGKFMTRAKGKPKEAPIDADPILVTGTRLTSDQVRPLYDQWADSLLTLDANKVADQYWPSSFLLPTLSNIIRTDRKSKIDYFIEFLKKKPVGTVIEEFIITDGNNQAQYNSLYNFLLTDPVTQQQVIVPARFSFVFQTYDGITWNIKTHHSSALPNPVGSGTATATVMMTMITNSDHDQLSLRSDSKTTVTNIKKEVRIATADDYDGWLNQDVAVPSVAAVTVSS